MPISVQCDKCAKRYKVKDALAGKQVKCKICGHNLTVPEPAVILRHVAREREFELAIGDSDSIQKIEEHIEQHIGSISMVWHEIISDLVHLDVHQIAPTPDRPFHTLITTGMSDKPMTVPEGAEEFQFAELMLCLPESWPISQEDFNDEANYWPIRWLKMLARLPHEYETWLGFAHTVPNGDPPEPFSTETELCSSILAPPLLAPPEFMTLKIDDDKTVRFWGVVMLYAEELAFKLKKGSDPLFDRLDKYEVCELVEVDRRNVCKRRLWPFS